MLSNISTNAKSNYLSFLRTPCIKDFEMWLFLSHARQLSVAAIYTKFIIFGCFIFVVGSAI